MDLLKWLLPGIGIKRWVALLLTGVVILSIGSVNLSSILWPDLIAGLFSNRGLLLTSIGMVLGGVLIIWLGVRNIVRAVLRAISPVHGMKGGGKVVDALLRHSLQKNSPKIVAIGGGTGLSRLLLGLKEITTNITAVVTVADDGGSSGRLRQLDYPAPGDIRNCILSLASASEETQALFSYRFEDDDRTPQGLGGHSFGNIFLATLSRITGDFPSAVRAACQILDVQGDVLPVTNCTDVRLLAELTDGRTIAGETQIGAAPAPIKELMIEPDCGVTADVARVIKEADLVVLGPGSLYTSTIATLLPSGMREALRVCSGKIVYISNVMTQANESLDYSTADHVQAIEDHIGTDIIDAVLVNKTPIPAYKLGRYELENADVVEVDRDRLAAQHYEVIYADLVDTYEELTVRHDPVKVAWELARLLYREGK